MRRHVVLTGLGLVLSMLACAAAGMAWIETRAARAEMLAGLPAAHAAAGPCVSAPGLGDRMNTLARRFAGVWYAATSGNRDLAEYELHEMEETIEAIELLRPVENGVDVANVLEALANSQLADLRAAAVSGDAARLKTAYQATMEACNACHVSSGHPFIHIVSPTAPPVSNRRFDPVAGKAKPVLVSGHGTPASD